MSVIVSTCIKYIASTHFLLIKIRLSRFDVPLLPEGLEPIDFCEVKQRKPEPSTGGLVYKYCMMAQGFGCVIRDYQRGSLSNGLLIQTASSRLNQGN